MSKNFVLDTNVLLVDPKCVTEGFEENNIIIPLHVLSELDHMKGEMSNRGFGAREAMREIERICDADGDNVTGGVKRNEEGGTLRLVGLKKGEMEDMNEYLPMDCKDDFIILTALKVYNENKDNTVFVSNDRGCRLKAMLLDIPTELYKKSNVDRESYVYTGYRNIEATVDFYEPLFVEDKGKKTFSGMPDVISLCEIDLTEDDVLPNEFVLIVPSQEASIDMSTGKTRSSSLIKKMKGVYRYRVIVDEKTNEVVDKFLEKRDLSFKNLYGKLSGKNLEQSCALDLLMDDDVKVVTLKSPAGSGKTILSIACALTKLLKQKDSPYKKILFLKPTVSVSNDIGFLPGTANDKLAPFMSSFLDNINVLRGMEHTNNKTSSDKYEDMVENGQIEVECISFIRGRSLNDCIIISDENQNIDGKTMKTIMSRVGENCRVFVLGDVAQIDVNFLSEKNNGLSHLINNFKGLPFYGHITLDKCERSAVSDAAGKRL